MIKIEKHITSPLTDDIIESLKEGEWVTLSGIIYTARDQAHKKMYETILNGKKLPFNPIGAIIYYTGPTPPPEHKPIGSAGPTTSSRMDPFTKILIDAGIKGFIGKGSRNLFIKDYIKSHKCVYFEIPGGIGALISTYIKKAEIIAYPELQTEAIRRIEVVKLPLRVSIK